MFWYLLNRVGLLEERGSDLKNDQLLKVIYDKKFLPEYGLNFVNLVDRPTVDVTELQKARGADDLRDHSHLRPKVVCFVGKIAFNTFRNDRKCDWGRELF